MGRPDGKNLQILDLHRLASLHMSLQVKKLKTKSLSRTGENKEETASKVKVLREKQSQWMKEREASKTATKELKSVNKDNSTLPDVPKFRTRSAMSGSSSENAANRNPHSNPRRKPLYPEPQRDRTQRCQPMEI